MVWLEASGMSNFHAAEWRAGLKPSAYIGQVGHQWTALDRWGYGIVPWKLREGQWLNGLCWLDLYRKRWCWMLAIRCRGCQMQGIFGLNLM